MSRYMFTAAELIASYAKDMGVDVLADNRTREVVRPRQEIMTALYKTKRYSYPAIGSMFDRDHTTVMHAIERVEMRELSDPAVEGRVSAYAKMGTMTESDVAFRRNGGPMFKSVRAVA